MKRFVIAFACIVFSVVLHGQIAVSLESNHPAYLRYEPVRLRITLTNQSGNTLVFGGSTARETGRLLFNVSSLSGRNVRHLDMNANPLSDVIMAPGESKVLYLRLNSLFDIQREDTYTITAVVSHSRLDSRYKSNTLTLEVRDGLEEETRYIGLPSSNSYDKIQKIHFVLLRFRDVEGSLYCLRAEDDRKVYGTFRVGPYIMGGLKPQMEVENGNTLHLLLQVAPRLYCYTTYSVLKNEIRKRQEVYYSAVPGRTPRLGRETGYLKVHNVILARLGKDYNKEPEKPFGDE